MAQSQIQPHNLSLVFLSLDPPPAQCSFRNEARVSEQPGEFQLGQGTQITNAWGLNTWHLGGQLPSYTVWWLPSTCNVHSPNFYNCCVTVGIDYQVCGKALGHCKTGYRLHFM